MVHFSLLVANDSYLLCSSLNNTEYFYYPSLVLQSFFVCWFCCRVQLELPSWLNTTSIIHLSLTLLSSFFTVHNSIRERWIRQNECTQSTHTYISKHGRKLIMNYEIILPKTVEHIAIYSIYKNKMLHIRNSRYHTENWLRFKLYRINY